MLADCLTFYSLTERQQSKTSTNHAAWLEGRRRYGVQKPDVSVRRELPCDVDVAGKKREESTLEYTSERVRGPRTGAGGGVSSVGDQCGVAAREITNRRMLDRTTTGDRGTENGSTGCFPAAASPLRSAPRMEACEHGRGEREASRRFK